MVATLDKYEIEEESVRLVFKDGSSRLVGFDDLAVYLSGRELAKVKRAVTIRQNFIKTVLPPWAKVMIISVGAFALMFNLNRVAGFFGIQPITPRPEPPVAATQHIREDQVSDGGPGGNTATSLQNQESTRLQQSFRGASSQLQPALPYQSSLVASRAVSGDVPISSNASAKAFEAVQNNPDGLGANRAKK